MFKTYATAASAKTAIKKAGLSGMIVRYDSVDLGHSQHIMPVVLCDLIEDTAEVESRGFKAAMKRTKMVEGATVMLKPGVTGSSPDMAVIRALLDDIEGGVQLDRPLAGCRYWNTQDLTLIAPDEDD